MTELSFLQPGWFWLIPLAWVWLLFQIRQRIPWPQLLPLPTIRFPLPQLRSASDDRQTPYSARQDCLATLALTAFIIALAHPILQPSANAPATETVPLDTVFLVDTNITMILRDVQIGGEYVDRMTMTRRHLSDLIDAYQGERLGLSLMGSPPIYWLPLSTDHAAIKASASRIRATLGGRLSDMAQSLNMIAERYPRVDSPVLVMMLTDSMIQIGAVPPQEAARQLHEKGYVLCVVAIGSTELSEAAHAQVGYVYEPVDLKLLNDVAQAGGGELIHATTPEILGDAFVGIQTQYVRAKQESTVDNERTEIAQIPLLIGMFALGVAMLGWTRLPSLRRPNR